MSLRLWWVVAGLASAIAASAHAAGDEDLREIRRQIDELKATYEARIQALEQRLKEAEARAAAPEPMAPAAAPAAGAVSGPSSAFNPAISVVLQGRYANLSQDPASFAIAGFPTRGDAGPGKRGFSLSESELTLAANVDQQFAGVLTFSLSPDDSVSVEEAYGTMIAPLHGVSPRFGRFLSGIGYLNEQHQHAWDFVDAPLAYQAFLGGQHRNDGLQVRWLAPTEHYIEVGVEVGNGNGSSGSGQSGNGIESPGSIAGDGGSVRGCRAGAHPGGVWSHP